ncbi:MAG: hypothetical protein KGZ79_09755 [Dethiobacter sp.]|jgi:uncharacterized membrane protein|nr:hypothetical protein [Dethiobacter sp.]
MVVNLQVSKSSRFQEIDALRGAAVLLMVFNHGLEWMYSGTAHDVIRIFGSLSLGDIATPMFYGASFTFLLLGIGICLILLGVFRFNFIQKSVLFRQLVQVGKDSLFIKIKN